MKIIHTSDWHLGAKLHERDRAEEHRRFLAFLRDLAADEKPDALVVTGDVFDVRQPSNAAQRLYYDFIADTARDGCAGRIVVTAGNHDSAQMLSAADQVLRRLGVTIIAKAGDDPVREVVVLRHPDGEPGLAIAAVPFMNDAELANFARSTPEGCEDCGNADARAARGFHAHYSAVMAEAKRLACGAPVVALGHCFAAGATPSDVRSERGRQAGGLDGRGLDAFAGADHVALGHLHIPQNVGADGRVRYSGSPLAMSFAEAGKSKSVDVVTFGKRAGDNVDVRQIEVPEFTPLRRLEGDQQSISAAFDALAASATSPMYAALKVTCGDGDMAAFIAEMRTKASTTKIEILPIEDARVRASGVHCLSECDTLEATTPLEVARLRLAEEHLSAGEIERYAALISTVANGLEP